MGRLGRNRLESARVGPHGSGPRRAPGGIIKLLPSAKRSISVLSGVTWDWYDTLFDFLSTDEKWSDLINNFQEYKFKIAIIRRISKFI
jgi:hypothetical protein